MSDFKKKEIEERKEKKKEDLYSISNTVEPYVCRKLKPM